MELGAVAQSGEWEEDLEEGEGSYEPEENLAVARAKVLLSRIGGAGVCKRCHTPGHNSIECRMPWDKIVQQQPPFQQPPRK